MLCSPKQIDAFVKLLDEVNVNTLQLTPYPQQYLKHLLQHKRFYVQLLAWALHKTLQQSPLQKEEIILIDFGAGNGLLALFAKFCGIKKVFACEVREEFIEAIKQLAKALNLEIDGYIKGNETQLVGYFINQPPPNVIIGTDVIEHVYSIDDLLKISKALNPTMLIGFTTGSVNDNYFKRKSLYNLMYKDEYKGSNQLHTSQGNEYKGIAFWQVRKQLIAKKYAQLTETEINNLSTATRGYNEQEIYKIVNEYTATNKRPQPTKHPYNTCDPITGSFTERMLTTKQYKALYNNNNYDLIVYNGLYNAHQQGIKGVILKGINVIINLKPKGYITRAISPVILLVGK